LQTVRARTPSAPQPPQTTSDDDDDVDDVDDDDNTNYDSDEMLSSLVRKKRRVLESSDEEEQTGDVEMEERESEGDDMEIEGEFSAGESEGEEIKGLGKYGPACQPTNVMQSLIKGWNTHLTSPDGGYKSKNMVRQMCQQVDTIYEEIGHPTAMPDIFDKDVIYNRFFKPKLLERVAGGKKGMSVNTLLVYIHHYRLFAIHVKQSLQLSTMLRETIEKLVNSLPGWRESVRKTRMEQKTTREWNERKTARNPPTDNPNENLPPLPVLH
ncbi:hypothetical protein QZH41_012026, partial [Actinostola sp. cb2023]